MKLHCALQVVFFKSKARQFLHLIAPIILIFFQMHHLAHVSPSEFSTRYKILFFKQTGKIIASGGTFPCSRKRSRIT